MSVCGECGHEDRSSVRGCACLACECDLPPEEPAPAPADEREDRNAVALGEALAIGWGQYVGVFGEEPHGTAKQLAALVELIPDAAWAARGGRAK